MRRFVSALLFPLLIMGLFSSVSVLHVEASGTIYIKANGRINPATAPIITFDNVTYTFTDNINGSIFVERAHIVVDGAGFILQGDGVGDGFTLNHINNVTIKNTFLWVSSEMQLRHA